MAEETLLSPEEEEETSAAEMAAQSGEPTVPDEGATPPGEVAPPADEFEYEYVKLDGTKERLSPKEMADRLANYNKMQGELGTLQNEKAAWQNKPAPAPAPTPQGEGTQVDLGDLSTVDPDDPEAMLKVARAQAGRIAAMEQQIKSFPDQAKEIADKDRIETELNVVMAKNTHLEKFTPGVDREAIVKVAAALASSKGNYVDLETSVNAYFAMFGGAAKPVEETHAGFVRTLLKSGGEVLPASGGTPIGNVVQRYRQITDEDKRAEFLGTLSDEEQELIDAAEYAR